MAHHLVPLAGIAAANVAVDRRGQAGPLEISGNEGLSAGQPVVAGEGRVMVLLQDLQDEGRGRGRDEEATLLVK